MNSWMGKTYQFSPPLASPSLHCRLNLLFFFTSYSCVLDNKYKRGNRKIPWSKHLCFISAKTYVTGETTGNWCNHARLGCIRHLREDNGAGDQLNSISWDVSWQICCDFSNVRDLRSNVTQGPSSQMVALIWNKNVLLCKVQSSYV
jgi:hypothetical protein